MSLHHNLASESLKGAGSDALYTLTTLATVAGRFYAELALTVDDYNVNRLFQRWARLYQQDCPITSATPKRVSCLHKQRALLVCNNYQDAKRRWQKLQPQQKLAKTVKLEQESLSLAKALLKQDIASSEQDALASWLADLQLLLEDSQTLAERHRPH